MPAVSSHSLVRQPRPASVMLAAACLALATRAAPTTAQTVSPPIAEYQQRARSSFQLINSGIYPLSVVLEVRGFRVTEQEKVAYRRLAAAAKELLAAREEARREQEKNQKRQRGPDGQASDDDN